MVKYVQGDDHRYGAWNVVRYFEAALARVGWPVKFTRDSGELKQLNHAKRLLKACKQSRAEVEALIDEFVRDGWEVEHNRCLSRVVAKADDLRACIARRQRVEAEFTWWEDAQ